MERCAPSEKKLLPALDRISTVGFINYFIRAPATASPSPVPIPPQRLEPDRQGLVLPFSKSSNSLSHLTKQSHHSDRAAQTLDILTSSSLSENHFWQNTPSAPTPGSQNAGCITQTLHTKEDKIVYRKTCLLKDYYTLSSRIPFVCLLMQTIIYASPDSL